MRVVVPYTRFSRAQANHLRMDGYTPEYRFVGDDALSYSRLLEECWRRREDFVVVEHDIFPWPGAISTFDTCPKPWCAFPYLYDYAHSGPTLIVAHGCVRFRAELQEAVLDLFDRIRQREWWNLDSEILNALTAATGEPGPHRHDPPVVHAKDAPTVLPPEAFA